MLALTGCVHLTSAPRSSLPLTSVELAEIPFFADDTTLCGPSVLAAMLQQSGQSISVAQLKQQIYLPEKGGSLQVEMLAGARRHNTLPVALALDGSPNDLQQLHTALQHGYPVMVLQRLRALWVTSYHYAIVVGYDAAKHQFILRSGVNERLFVSRRKLLRSVNAGGRWAYVLLRHGREVPEFVQSAPFLNASITLESIGRYADAAKAYEQGAARWPDEYLFSFGLANTFIAQQNYKQAIQQLLTIQQQHPDHAMVLNNLAAAYAEQRDFNVALQWIKRAINLNKDKKAELETLCATYRSIHQATENTHHIQTICDR